MRERLLMAFSALFLLLLVTGCMGTVTHASSEPSADHSVYLDNRGNESATVGITIVRNATDAIVHDWSYRVDPGERRAVYNTDSASPDGIETFEIHWAVRNETGQVAVRTNQCFGHAYVLIREDGTAGSTYSVC
ncbi:hypothetical protein SAMN05216559_1904 [Halomicrobium zhouii]|uniref:Uncharacterized protein n=1 Tax=Halomicrobium zhouii TaxID=767519 RepID=A0A1I6L3B2_9EURY|nr:hypothetical protein [Halomicrobium zhouii]SFR97730.1 hypothetical protein SAMN05216559_1904 [Halomicrobium zhouii]